MRREGGVHIAAVGVPNEYYDTSDTPAVRGSIAEYSTTRISAVPGTGTVRVVLQVYKHTPVRRAVSLA